jgi:hypothetical protein
MHQSTQLHRRVLHGALVMLERSAAKVARCVLRGERSREAPDLPGGFSRPERMLPSEASLFTMPMWLHHKLLSIPTSSSLDYAPCVEVRFDCYPW